MNRKTIKTVVIVLVLLLAGVAAMMGVNTVKQYLGGAAAGEEPTNVQAQPDDSSATISWQTEKSVLGVVEYGTNQSNLLLRAPESQPSTIHRVTLAPLAANTTYYYRIRVGETIYDNAGIPFSFKTKGAAVVPTATPLPTVAVSAPTTTPAPDADSSDLTKTCDQGEFEAKMGSADAAYDFDENGVVNGRDWQLCLQANR